MNVEKINVNGITYDLRDVEDVSAEIARAQAAEQELQSNIAAEVERATAQEQQLQKNIDAEGTRAKTAEGKLREGTTARFARFVDSASIDSGLLDSVKEVVYIKSTNKFAAADSAGNFWGAWDGVDEYMNGNEVRKDKVYLCGDATYVFHNGVLRDRVAELIGEAPDTLDSIHEIAAWILNDKSGAAAMATQISENKAAIEAEVERAEGAEVQLNNSLSAEAQRAEAAEQLLQGKIDTDVAAEATRAKAAEAELDARKADEDGYHPKMSVGFSDNLVGRGEDVDAQFTYRPSGGTQSIEDGVARIERIKGNTIVWNQLAKISDSVEINGVTITNNGDGTYSVITQADTFSTADVFFPVTDSFANGRKVIFYGSPSNASASTYCLKAQTAGVVDIGSGEIIASTSNNEVIGIFIAAGTTIDTAVKFRPQVFDLTLMFGMGNEPTKEEFKTLYPYTYGYNKGELKSLHTTAIKSVGFNLLNLEGRSMVEFEKGTIRPNEERVISEKQIWNVISPNGFAGSYYEKYTNISIGDNAVIATGATSTTSGYGLGFPIKVLPEVKYTINYSGIGQVGVGYYKSNGILISHRTASSTFTFNFITPADCYWAMIVFLADKTSSKLNITNITLSITHSGYRDGDVEDYKEFTRELPIKEYFPDGMKSAENVFDEITKDKVVKRVGAVDLGSIDYTYGAAGSDYPFGYFYGTLPTAYIFNNQSTVVCERYATGRFSRDKSIFGNTTGDKRLIYIVDSNYTDPTALKASLAGVFAFTELREPIVTEITGSINLDYEVSDFGTEEAISEENSAPFRADIVYGFNAVDTIRNNRTMIAELLARIEALEGK